MDERRGPSWSPAFPIVEASAFRRHCPTSCGILSIEDFNTPSSIALMSRVRSAVFLEHKRPLITLCMSEARNL